MYKCIFILENNITTVLSIYWYKDKTRAKYCSFSFCITICINEMFTIYFYKKKYHIWAITRWIQYFTTASVVIWLSLRQCIY